MDLIFGFGMKILELVHCTGGETSTSQVWAFWLQHSFRCKITPCKLSPFPDTESRNETSPETIHRIVSHKLWGSEAVTWPMALYHNPQSGDILPAPSGSLLLAWRYKGCQWSSVFVCEECSPIPCSREEYTHMHVYVSKEFGLEVKYECEGAIWTWKQSISWSTL